MSHSRYPIGFALLVTSFLLGATGCPRSTERVDEQAKTFASYAELPGLQATHSTPLKTEYAMLVAERATPAMLDEDADKQVDDEAVDLRLVLEEQFNASALEYAMERTERMFDGAELRWDSVTLVQASQFGRQYEKQRSAVRQNLEQANVHISLALSQGVGLKVEFIDAAHLYHRLETFHAANQLTTGDLDGTLATLRLMFRLQTLLGAQKHVVARLTAAECRQESLGIVQAIASNSTTDVAHWNTLRQMIDGQLVSWPSDGGAWIGDRAQGLHMYEMIRDGHLLSLLTGEELAELSQDRSLTAFTTAALKSIDKDEAFYLRSMRELIDVCDSPYFQRKSKFNELRGALEDLQKTPDYPLIADRLLLNSVEQGQERQALDRAWMEAWSNALSLASAAGEPPFPINPVTGRAYQIEYKSGVVEVSRIDPSVFTARVTVPLRRAQRLSSGASLPPPR